VLGAVRELRFLINEANMRSTQTPDRLTGKPKYSMTGSGEPPLDFLFRVYGKEIREGTVGPGQISRHDINLYSSLRRYLRSLPEWEGRTVSDLFREAGPTPDRQGTTGEQRARACATILGTDETTATRFLAGLRKDRWTQTISPPDGKGRG